MKSELYFLELFVFVTNSQTKINTKDKFRLTPMEMEILLCPAFLRDTKDWNVQRENGLLIFWIVMFQIFGVKNNRITFLLSIK
jgi:hypothetical protein